MANLAALRRIVTERRVVQQAAQAVIAIEDARLLNQPVGNPVPRGRQTKPATRTRVADQVGEIERMSRLRRFLPPQVADLIVASGSEKQLESHRREITALFCDRLYRKRRRRRRDSATARLSCSHRRKNRQIQRHARTVRWRRRDGRLQRSGAGGEPGAPLCSWRLKCVMPSEP